MAVGVLESLQAGLGASYVIERELGGGGMSQVFLATERALDRRVVVKVLGTELAHSVSAERFRREIQLLAHLQHPHIVPLLTAGQTGDLLYYTMPFVEGESLKARLERQGELPVPEAVRTLTEIARALRYAHEHGIVHRDIKPGNILLTGGEAQVADFGIAKALSKSVQAGALTSSGVVLGTPLYMAPEQAAGGGEVDERSDLYSLGVVAYEMLTGAPPFTGRAPRAVLAAHVIEQPISVAVRRPSVPAGLSSLVMGLLAKHPADRPQSATEVLQLLESVATSTPTLSLPAARRRAVLGWYRLLMVGVIMAVGLAVALAGLRHGRPAASLDPQVIAVVPFRVTGADSSLRYLRDGMVDLLSAKLSGTVALRTVDPRTLLRAWHQAGGSVVSDLDRANSLRLARELGAGRLVEGEVTGTPQRLTLNARLWDAAGREEVRGGVEGPADSLTWFVDQLVAQLLTLSTGEGQHRLAALTTTSLPALRAYLDGRAATRRGDFAAGRDLFDRAIDLDSSFALAGLGRTLAAIWLGEGYAGPGTALAWRHRDRLPKRDLFLLYFMRDRRWPLLAGPREDIANGESLVASAPDSPEAWTALADQTFHYGSLIGMLDARERSLRAFERAVTLDSGYAPGLEHLYELYFGIGDTAASRKALALLLGLDSTSAVAGTARWFARTFLRDSVLGAAERSAPPGWAVIGLAAHHGLGLAGADSVLTARMAGVASEAQRRELQELSWTFYVIRGQPRRALTSLGDLLGPARRSALVLDALYADADSSVAAGVATEMPRVFKRPTLQSRWEDIAEGYALAQYGLAGGHPRAARNAVRAWSGAWTPQDTSQAAYLASHLAMLLDAQLASLEHRPDALARLTELDSVLQAAPSYGGYLASAPTLGGFEPVGNLIAARLWQERGQSARALAAVRRRIDGWMPPAVFIAQLRDEARYDALIGDRQGAIRAYRHYLALRSDPEPRLRGQVRAVRGELEALQDESVDR